MTDFIPKVVDISHYEEIDRQDWQKVKDYGIVGIICKASQGTNYKDPMYDEFREGALSVGLEWGAYHFNSAENVVAQVNKFLDASQPDPRTLLALDYEENRRSDMTIHQAVDFLHLIEEKMGRKAIIYSGNKLKETIDDLNRVDRDYITSHKLWLAQYGSRYRFPNGFDDFFLWQYTGDGVGPEPHWVPGIRCPGNKGLDLNVTNLSDDDLRAAWV